LTCEAYGGQDLVLEEEHFASLDRLQLLGRDSVQFTAHDLYSPMKTPRVLGSFFWGYNPVSSLGIQPRAR